MLEQKMESWYKKTGYKIVNFIFIAAVVYIIIRLRILNLIAPFITAWIMASLLNPVVTWLNQKVRVPRGIGTIFSMATILSGILWVITLLVRQLWYQIIAFTSTFPEYSKDLIAGADRLEARIGSFLSIIPGTDAFSNLDHLLEQLLGAVGTSLTAKIPGLYDTIIKVPNIIIFVIVMLIATFFMTKDYYDIKLFVKAQLSDTVIKKIAIMQQGMVGALGGYIKTQLILMLITFSICLTGLLLFRINYALLISFVIALIDALPMFGSGAILWPWAIYNIIMGNYMLAVGLLGIYGVIFVMRQIMEPKILSQQIGMYALVTVMSMYIGYKLIGVFGLILGPLVMVVLKTLQSIGMLPQFKPVKDQMKKEIKDENRKR